MALKARPDKQPMKSGHPVPKKGGAKSAKASTARLSKGKYCS